MEQVDALHKILHDAATPASLFVFFFKLFPPRGNNKNEFNKQLYANRWCKKPGICGRDVIRESAYCYVEGSFCQKWIHRKIRASHEDENQGNN